MTAIMLRRTFLLGFASSVVFFGGSAVAGEKVYSYRCPECGRVKESTHGGETLYCEGEKGERHSKRTMERVRDENAKSIHYYKCPTCDRVIPSEKAGETL